MRPEISKKDTTYPILKSEVNFLSFPFFCLAKSDLNSTGSIQYEKTVDRPEGKVKILWCVTAHGKLGIPGPFDKEVHRAIEALITRRGFPVKNPIPFTLYELCQVMDVHQGGAIKQKIKEALIRITMTGIESQQAFYTKTDKSWIEEYFHLYEHVIFKGKSRPDTHEIADTNYLFLGKWYLNNLNAFYIKTLDYSFYRNLETPTDKRYYEIMGLKFHAIFSSNINFVRFRYSTLCDLFPLTRQPYLSLAKQQLNPSHKRLKKQGFFKKVTWHKTNEKNDWLLYFYPGPKAHDLLNPKKLPEPAEIESLTDFDAEQEQMEFAFDAIGAEPAQNSWDKYYKYYKLDNNNSEAKPDEPPAKLSDQSVVALSDRLTEFKIPNKLATQYVAQYSPEYLEEKIQIIEFRKSKDRRIKNTGGMLRRAIEENWQPSEALTATKEKRQLEIEKHERLQAEEEQAAIEQAKDKAVEEWISVASDSLVAEIHEQAAREIKEENPKTKKQFLRILTKIRVKDIIASKYLGENFS